MTELITPAEETTPKNNSQEIVDALREIFDDKHNYSMHYVAQRALLNLAYACFDLQYAEFLYFGMKKPFDEGDFSSRHTAVGRALERLKSLSDKVANPEGVTAEAQAEGEERLKALADKTQEARDASAE